MKANFVLCCFQTDCNINLGFVLDGSASVEGTRRGNFLKMINFVKDTIHEFVKLSQQVHVGTLVYSTRTSVILSFGTKGTEKVIDQLLDKILYPGLLREGILDHFESCSQFQHHHDYLSTNTTIIISA